ATFLVHLLRDGQPGSLDLKWVDDLPVVLHVRQYPAPAGCLVERPGETSDLRFAVVTPFAIRVGVVDDHSESPTGSRRRPAQHLEVAVGVPEGGDRPLADGPLNSLRLAGPVVDQLNLGQADESRRAVALLVFRLDGAADHLFRRDAVDILGPSSHELG